jgi:hypothetical protein
MSMLCPTVCQILDGLQHSVTALVTSILPSHHSWIDLAFTRIKACMSANITLHNLATCIATVSYK